VDGTRQLNGMIWNAGETLSPVVIGDDGALSKGDTKNVSSAAAEGESVISERKTVTLKYSTVNSLTMNAADGLSEVLFGANGQSEILSGMVLFRYSGTNALKRIAATSGSITTRNPGGLVLFANGVCERELALGGESNHLKVEGPFADPDGGTPLAMTFASRRQGSPDRGALYWLSSTANTFSGGVNLNDGAVAIASDASLGAAAAPVHVSGDSLLMSAEGPLILPAMRTIELADKARFVLRSASEGNAAQVAATVKGTGDLYVNKFDSTMAMKLTGDVSGFTGDYYISGTLEAASLPEKSGIRFAGDTVPGVLETNGVFDRDLTTKEGGIAWIGAACYGADKAFGGLAAKGGDLAVDFGGAGETVTLPERDFDAVTALSGSGPAYFAYMEEAMAKAGVALGLDPAVARLLAEQTMYGTAKFLRESGMDLHAFISGVCTKGGTTAAGMAKLDRPVFKRVVAETLAAAAARSKELA
jgi:hypothetical protein